MWPYTNNLRMISHKSTISSGLTRSEGWVSSLVSFIFDRNGKRKQKATTDPADDRSAAEKGRKGGSDRDRRIHNKYRAEDLKIFPAKPLQNLADGRGYSAATRSSQEKETYIKSACDAHAKFLKQPGFSEKKATKYIESSCYTHAEFLQQRGFSKKKATEEVVKHVQTLCGEKLTATAPFRSDHRESMRCRENFAATVPRGSDEDEDVHESHIASICRAREKELKRDGASQKEMTKATTKLAQRLRKAM